MNPDLYPDEWSELHPPPLGDEDLTLGVSEPIPWDDEIDVWAERDEDVPSVVVPAPSWWDYTLAASKLPQVSTGIGALDSAIELRAGQLCVVVGGPGSGKTSLVLQLAAHHARSGSPSVFCSAELTLGELGARLVSQVVGCSWSEALAADVDEDRARRASDIPLLCAIDGHNATIRQLDEAVERARDQHPDRTPLAVVDYVQLCAMVAPGGNPREQVNVVIEGIRRMAQVHGATVLALSQTSRASSRALRSGEMLGTEAISAGAETAQLERSAHVVLALSPGDAREDGKIPVAVSLAKVRAGQGDRVLPMLYDGRTGLWSSDGDAESATAVREKRQTAAQERRVKTAELAVLGHVRASAEPLSRRAIIQALGGRAQDKRLAITALLERGDLVQVRGRWRGGAYRLWTSEQAEGSDVDVVPRSLG